MKRQGMLKARKIKFERRSPSKKDEIHKIDQKLNRVQIHRPPKDGFHKVKWTGIDIRNAKKHETSKNIVYVTLKIIEVGLLNIGFIGNQHHHTTKWHRFHLYRPQRRYQISIPSQFSSHNGKWIICVLIMRLIGTVHQFYWTFRSIQTFLLNTFEFKLYSQKLSQNMGETWTQISSVEEIVKTFESITTVYQEDEFKTWVLQKEVSYSAHLASFDHFDGLWPNDWAFFRKR